jgi:hypothetical protein
MRIFGVEKQQLECNTLESDRTYKPLTQNSIKKLTRGNSQKEIHATETNEI